MGYTKKRKYMEGTGKKRDKYAVVYKREKETAGMWKNVKILER